MLMFWLMMASAAAAPFVSVWRSTANGNLTLPFYPSSNIMVQWGDGIESNYTEAPVYHTYAISALYEVTIYGEVKGFSSVLDDSKDLEKLLSISSWGEFTVDATSVGAFAGAINLEDITATDQPIFLEGATMEGFFASCEKLNSALSWNISGVVSLSSAFSLCSALNQPLTFTTSSALQTTEYMFIGCTSLNMPVHISDTSYVTSMKQMFAGCFVYNQPVVLNTKHVVNMTEMFNLASNFNQSLDFDTPNLKTCEAMFQYATSFNSVLNFTDTSNLQSTLRMFEFATSFNQPLGNWSISNDIGFMFHGASSFNQRLLFTTTWTLYMDNVFQDATAFNQVVNFDTSSVETMRGMFSGASSFNQVVNFVTDVVKLMDSMFAGCVTLNKTINFTSTALVTDMSYMFANCTQFNQPLNFNTASVLYAQEMFAGASSFKQDLAAWTTQETISCSNFCQFCALPAFSLCTPCDTPRLTMYGWTTCSCVAPQIVINETYCDGGWVESLAPTAAPTLAPSRSLAPSAVLSPAGRAAQLCPFVMASLALILI